MSAAVRHRRHGRLWTWIDGRVGLTQLGELARHKEVPVHRHTVWYYLGGMTLFLFVLQVATGILLLLYYRPSEAEAWESVQFLMAEVQFGWLIRSLHAWAANLMILILFGHLFSVLLLGAYRPNREVTWFSGVLLLFLVLAFGFTGYLLPWSERSFFATRVGTQLTGVLPLVGPFARRLLLGGNEVTGASLTRFFGFHVAILPALATLLVGVHLLLVQKHGMSIPLGVERRGGPRRRVPFLPDFLLRDLVGWLSALALLVVLAALWPTDLGRKADPFAAAPAGIRPEWYFMAMFQTLKLLPSHIAGAEGEVVGMVSFLLAGVFLLVLPLLDRRAAHGRRGKLFLGIGVAMILYLLGLTVMGYVANPTR